MTSPLCYRAFALLCAIATALLCLIASPGELHAQQPQPPTRRWAVLLSAEAGGSARARLRYAHQDAQALEHVLVQLGGVSASDTLHLQNPTPAQVSAQLARLGGDLEQARREGARTELILYYSGHSDERGLLLGDARMSYALLRAQIEAVSADVRVIILDSCASGALTRHKGGAHVPGFLQDASTRVSGQAILTSSSADEAAQESDRLQASFFTHALLSGLRGGADANGDRRITLNEAYQFAFNETLQRTEQTSSGAQHPAYELRLAGQGELVLTDLSKASSAIVMARAQDGELFVRDAQGRLVAELTKRPGRAMELSLPEGRYTLLLVEQSRARQATITLARGQRLALETAAWKAAPLELTRTRGGGVRDDDQEDGPLAPLLFGVDLFPFVGTSSAWPERPRRFSLNLVGGISGGLSGLELGGALNINTGPTHGAQLSAVNLTTGDLYGAQVGGFNLASEASTGLQIGAINWLTDDLVGAQIGALNWLTDDLHGAQVGGLNIAAGDADSALQVGAFNHLGSAKRALQIGGITTLGSGFWGTQIAGVAVAMGDVTGAQISAMNITAGQVRGAQVGGVNVAAGSVYGTQVGGVNVTGGSIYGTQIGGVNVASGDSEGPQIGAINITAGARRGVLIGAINIAEDADVAIGAITIFTKGRTAVTAWADDTGGAYAGVKHGNDSFYQVYHVGTRLGGDTDEEALSFGIGLGGRRPVSERWGLAADLLMHTYPFGWKEGSQTTALYQVRGLASWRALSWLSLYGGPSVNVFLSDTADAGDWALWRKRLTAESRELDVSIWPGASFGVDLHL